MNALTRDLVNLVNTAEENQTAKEQTSGAQFREKLHLMPPVGWLNDPNGLCQMDGVFHAFFQYSPFNAEGGVKMWGHYTSTNLIDWEYKGVSLYPDQPFDCHGVYSGSAFLEDGTMYLYYTGNVKLEAGDFDLRGFEVTNASLFDANKRPYVLFQSKQIKFSTDCVRQFGKDNKVELLIHPGLRKLAVRRASKDSRQCVQWSRPDDGKYYAKEIPCTAFGGTLFELLDWETDFKFRAYGRLLQNEGDSVFIFDLSEPEIFIQSYLMTGTDSPISGNGELSPLSVSGKRVRAVPKKLADRFGSDFYSHRLTASSPELQSEDAWKLWLEGQLFETGEKLRVTKFDEMQRFIAEQLAPIKQKEEVDFNA